MKNIYRVSSVGIQTHDLLLTSLEEGSLGKLYSFLAPSTEEIHGLRKSDSSSSYIQRFNVLTFNALSVALQKEF